MEKETKVEWRLEAEEFVFAGCMHNCSGQGGMFHESEA
jgi:hypothetical protein